MKILKRILRAFLIVILLALAGGFIFIRHLSRRALPDYNKNITVAGLHSQVEVFRDSFAIPHIFASDEHDLYLIAGYLLAQDRLWQMDMLRRVTEGRLSEIFGEDYIGTDLLLRSLRFSDKSEQILSDLNSHETEALTSFATGINLFINDHAKKLPPEFAILNYRPEPWEPYQTLNMIGYMAWDLKAGWSEILMVNIRQTVDSLRYKDILPRFYKMQPTVYPSDHYGSFSSLLPSRLLNSEKLQKIGADVFDGSNNWAVNGTKSATGKPLLANDMHLGLNVPGVWYQMHQVIPGRLNVTGLVLPGAPAVICGHNDSIAWGMTNTYVDNLDFYEEKIHPEDSSLYEYKGEWRKFEIRNEIIRTKGGEEVSRILMFSHRGPVVSSFKDFSGKVVTMHWVGDEMSNEIRSVFLLNRAQNWNEFTDALRTFTSISQNIAYADVKGNVGLFCAAGIPIRNRNEGSEFLPGYTDEFDWKGYVPFDELPRIYNPVSGYVASANNRTVPVDYPYHIGTWYSLPYRYERITELLEASGKMSVDDFMHIQLDQQSKMAEKYMPLILNALNAFSDYAELDQKALELLRNWDFNMEASGAGAVIFDALYIQLIQCIFHDELGDGLYGKFSSVGAINRTAVDRLMENSESPWFDDITTINNREKFNDMVKCAFSKAVSELYSQFESTPEDWAWGDIHQLTLKHPLSTVKILDVLFRLNADSYPVGGSFHTVSPFSYNIQKPFEVEHGSSHRHIYDAGNWDNSVSIIPTGNSGIPASKHYCDQTDMYMQGKYHPDYFTKEKISENARYHMIFEPATNK